MALPLPSTEQASHKRGRTRFTQNGGSNAFRARIESVGAFLPERRMSSRQVVDMCHNKPDIDLEGVTGIVERRYAAEHEDSLVLSLEAIKDCLGHSRYKAEELDIVVFCGITKYDGGIENLRFEPPLSVLISDRIGATKAFSFDIGNACAGMLTGLHVVNDFIRRGVARCGLVVSGEFISHLARNAARRVDGPFHLETASLTLGDAGAAAIVERCDDGSGIATTAFSTLAEHVELCTGSPCPDGPGGHMHTLSREIHQAGTLGTPAVVQHLLNEAELTLDDVEHVIMHQTAVRAIDRCSKVVGGMFGSERPSWFVNVDRVGNTASTSQFVALRRCLGEGRMKPGERVMMLAQASGLVLGGAVFTMDHLGERYVSQD